MALADLIKPCGPVADPAAAERTRGALAPAAEAGGWRALLERAWPALAPVAGAAPYLAGLMRRDPARLERLLSGDPGARLAALAAEAQGVDGELDAVKRALRHGKAELHLLTALCDLGGVWDLDQVTGALTAYADAAAQAALATAFRLEAQRGRLRPDAALLPHTGLFVLALGKHGAGELNYSSDIDVSVFFDPATLPVAAGVEPQALALRLTRTLAEVLQERTPDGYVFRVDLRLRPDPSSTPVAVSVEAALEYYESVGQNWERAAMIKARPCAGDLQAGAAFVRALQPFVWRRHLDYAAIADIQAIKREIDAHRTDARVTAPGLNLKLGRGGIREIEFFVQTQQLISGGRDPSLRSPRTLDALAALSAAGQVTPEAATELTVAYRRLRALEHRVQMLADEQTHILPQADEARARVAALAGEGSLAAFDSGVAAMAGEVAGRYGELFADETQDAAACRFGPLVFTGVEDDTETLATLERMGFAQPAQVSGLIRAWRHGRIPATRTERGRELFTQLTPRLLEAAQATGAPDAAFQRFADFLGKLASGVQIQSLFLNEPALFELVVRVMAFAPRLAATLARQPAALDALLDGDFFAPLDEGEIAAGVERALAPTAGLEAAMDAARRAHREQAFRIGVQVLSGAAKAEEAGRAFTALADACLSALAPAALAEAVRLGGAFPGEAAVVALGKAGSREMSARSDLDLMTVYVAEGPAAVSAGRGWGAETFYARFTQRLVAALSAPTAEGELYAVDLQLRPSGTAGPVAVSLAALERYYAAEAETWEFLALTRARVAWATSPAFAARVEAAIETALRRPRDRVQAAADVIEMRALMARERPPHGPWDLKLTPGGLIDIEFAAQYLQIVHAPTGGPLAVNTAETLQHMAEAGLAPAALIAPLRSAWRLQQDLTQVLKLALDDHPDPAKEPGPFRRLLAAAAGAADYAELEQRLATAQAQAHAAFREVVA